MASYLKSLNLTNGVEEVVKQIEVNAGGDLTGINTLNVTGGTNSIDIGDGTADGNLLIWNDNNKEIDISYSTNSTETLDLTIKNTKSTLDDGDILVFDDTDSTFKVDNISNYVGGGGNYNVLKVEFQGGNEFESTTIVPVGAVLDRIVIDRGAGLTTGTFPLQFLINGTSPLLLAEQGVQFDNDPGNANVLFFLNPNLTTVASGEEGTLKSTFLGTGTGIGTAYLLYWTALQT